MIAPSVPAPDPSLAAIVARLEDFLAKYLADCKKSGLTVSAAQLGAAVDEAIRRCREQAPTASPAGDSAEAFLLDGISAALVEEREGVHEKHTGADGAEIYRTVSVGVWVECLTALRKKFAG
jgi:hypothetical protein